MHDIRIIMLKHVMYFVTSVTCELYLYYGMKHVLDNLKL